MISLSVTIKDEAQFNKMKEFLTEEVLYLDWVSQMSEVSTSIVIISEIEGFSVGSVGSSTYQRSCGFVTVDFENLKF